MTRCGDNHKNKIGVLHIIFLILGSIFYEIDKKKAEKSRKGKEASAQAKRSCISLLERELLCVGVPFQHIH